MNTDKNNASSSWNNSSNNGVIQIQVREIGQLFNSLDPSPFLEKDLDQEAEDYIVSWAREEPPQAPLSILVHLPRKEILHSQSENLGRALNNYFDYRAQMADRELKELFRYGRAALAIGVPVLFACLFASHLVPRWFGPGPLSKLMQESLVMLGWVANWEPLHISLYGWWPVVRRRNLYRRLAMASVWTSEY
jgi:hypothetical protein